MVRETTSIDLVVLVNTDWRRLSGVGPTFSPIRTAASIMVDISNLFPSNPLSDAASLSCRPLLNKLICAVLTIQNLDNYFILKAPTQKKKQLEGDSSCPSEDGRILFRNSDYTRRRPSEVHQSVLARGIQLLCNVCHGFVDPHTHQVHSQPGRHAGTQPSINQAITFVCLRPFCYKKGYVISNNPTHLRRAVSL